MSGAEAERIELVITVRNLVEGDLAEERFSRSPVIVGRRADCDLLLGADSVSSRHGAFLLGPGSDLQYVDYASTNGTLVDGVTIAPNVPIPLRDRSVVGIGPFMLIVRTERGSSGSR